MQIPSNADAVLFVLLYLSTSPLPTQLPSTSSSPNKAMYMHIETGWTFSIPTVVSHEQVAYD